MNFSSNCASSSRILHKSSVLLFFHFLRIVLHILIKYYKLQSRRNKLNAYMNFIVQNKQEGIFLAHYYYSCHFFYSSILKSIYLHHQALALWKILWYEKNFGWNHGGCWMQMKAMLGQQQLDSLGWFMKI